MADYIKIPVDFFDMEPITTIEALYGRDGNSTILLYIALLCDTYRDKKKGVFKIGTIDITDNVISTVYRVSDAGRRLAILEEYGLIKRNAKSIEVYKFWQDLHDRSSDRYRQWRKSVFERDDYRCQSCGTKKDLQAHHIKTWKSNKDLRYSVVNGITLCRKCHLDAHGGCWRNG